MKILASDFDNTLFFSDGVHKQDVEEIYLDYVQEGS